MILNEMQEVLGVSIGLHAGFAAFLLISDLAFDGLEKRFLRTRSYVHSMLSTPSLRDNDTLKTNLMFRVSEVQLKLGRGQDSIERDKRLATLVMLIVAGVLCTFLVISVVCAIIIPTWLAGLGAGLALLLPFFVAVVCWSRSVQHLEKAEDALATLTSAANSLVRRDADAAQ